ncbi:MAG TPA: OB-fold domain-containing protein [Streptosporangiaceae bacterium]|nr:OB-fold domain-containing protein [Streptosporangiaceae bacterium]
MSVPSEPAGLFADHALEFPGGYTRSTGPVIGRFLTELRDGRIVGVAAPDGKILVPPFEYDPATGASVGGGPANAETGQYRFVPVGPAGTVTAWAWVRRPRDVHPLRQPFGWALIRMDGADTALLHAVDTGGKEKAMRTGLRVRPRWREASQRVGHIRDIECFVPEVTMLTAPSRVDYRLPAGRALSRFLEGIAQGKILGHRCGVCGQVYVPMRGLCPVDGVPTSEEVEVPDTGTITTFAVNNIPDPRAPQVPFVVAHILLDGADTAILALVGGVPANQVRMGMRVRAAWRPREEWAPSMANIRWFEPTGEADAPAESCEGHF